jgi:hypothetical protein
VLTKNREIGPIGTAARVIGGLIAIAVPISVSGFDWWDAATAFIALPLIATGAAALVTAGYRRWAPDALSRRGAICSAPACWLIGITVVAAVAIDLLIPASGAASLWVWLGVSMLVAAARGYGGCEVLAIPNLLTGRRDQIGCILYTPIDRAEARRAAGRRGALSAPR